MSIIAHALMEFNSYNTLKEQKVVVIDLLNFHFKEIGSSIKRKITTRQVRNPGRIYIRYKIPPPVFKEWYRAVRDYCTSYGVNFEVKRNKKKILTHTTLRFYHLGTLKYHFGQAAGIDVGEYFKKKIINSTGAVVVSDEKNAIFSYDVIKGLLTVQLNFELKNRYGNVCM